MGDKPIFHGDDHAPRSTDPLKTERWHLFDAVGEPALQGAWAQISGYAASGFKLIVGPPGHPNQTIEFMLNVDGGAAGSTVATIPLSYCVFTGGLKVAIKGHDSLGAYRAFHLDGSTGDIVAGV